MITIHDVMNKNVLTVNKDSTIFEAAEIMANKEVSCLVVVEDGNVKGILTWRDILGKVVIKKLNLEAVKASEIMASPVITINQDATLHAASGIMNIKKIKQLPVVNQGKLVGIITQTDVVRNINYILESDKMNIVG